MAPCLAAVAANHLFTSLFDQIIYLIAVPHFLTNLTKLFVFTLPVAIRAKIKVF
jgi:hypothetical protein